jgi:hypothetical protein
MKEGRAIVAPMKAASIETQDKHKQNYTTKVENARPVQKRVRM